MPDTSLPHRQDHPVPDASIVELTHQLTDQTSRLVRDEVKLAKAEIQASVKHAGIGAGLFGGAGLIALFGVGTLVAAAVLGLATAFAPWLAALVVGAALLVVAGLAALIGKSQVSKGLPPAPEQTIDNVKKDVAEIKEARS